MFVLESMLICVLGVGCVTLTPQEDRIDEWTFGTYEECIAGAHELGDTYTAAFGPMAQAWSVPQCEEVIQT